MPNRVLRDWTDSETVDTLTVHAERFYTRLIMKVDDYGRYSANVKILRSTLFPLKTDVRDTDISRWLTECKESGLIVIYNVSLKDFLQINNFNQTLRQKHEKYPSPDMSSVCIADDKQMISRCIPETKRNETELETEVEATSSPEQKKSFSLFQTWVKDNAPNVGKMKQPFDIKQFLEIKAEFTFQQISEMLLKMHNYKPLLTKNISAYLTFKNWARKDYNSLEDPNEALRRARK